MRARRLVRAVFGRRNASPDADGTAAEPGRSRERAEPVGVILMYHRVARLIPDTFGLCTHPAVFRDQMTHLRECHHPMPLEELARAARRGRISPGAVAVTLDDGYLDNLTVASPILQDAGVPATFFVNTERLDEEHECWWDVLERALLDESSPSQGLRIPADGEGEAFPTAGIEQRGATLRALHGRLLSASAPERARLLRGIVEWSGVDVRPRASHRVVTRDELLRLAREPGHSIGAHTASHLLLPSQPLATRRAEIVEHKASLERTLGRPVSAFSYPYGAFDEDTVAVVREAGFSAGVTVTGGAVGAGADPLRLPRCEIKGEAESFAASLRRLCGRADEGG